MRETDRAFVIRTWLASNRETAMGRNAGPAYEPEHKALIHLALKRGATVRVLCDAADEDTVWGFACVEPDASPCCIVHYVYVRNEFRRMGFARELLGELARAKAIATHRIVDALHFRGEGGIKMPALWHFNPYRFFSQPRPVAA